MTLKEKLARALEDLADAQGRIAHLRALVASQDATIMIERRARETMTDPFMSMALALGTNPKHVHRALARSLHPDMGGDVEDMKALNTAWAAR